MTEYQKNQTAGKDPQVTWILEPLLMSFKNNYIQENKRKKFKKRRGWGYGELHHKTGIQKRYQIKILELRNTIIAINVIDEFNIGLDTAKKKGDLVNQKTGQQKISRLKYGD